MSLAHLNVIDLAQQALATDAYTNVLLAHVNDHVVRLSIMTEPYFWHFHPDSDEMFLVIEGTVLIELENQMIELGTNQLFTIPKNVRHRTRPKGARSVNLTFESAGMTTIRVHNNE